MESMSPARACARLAHAAQAMFGVDWPRELSRFTEINLRTCQRVKAAIDRGEPDPRANSLLEELNRRLLGIAESLHGGPSLKVTGVRDNDLLRIRKLVADVEEGGRGIYGPYDHIEIELLLQEAAAREEAAANLLFTAAVAFGGGDATQEEEDHFFLRFNEACSSLGAIYGSQYQQWDVEMLIPPRRVFTDHTPLWPKLRYRRLFMIPCDDGESSALARFKAIENHADRPPGVEVQLYDQMFGEDFLWESESSSYYIVVQVLDSDLVAHTHTWLNGFSDRIKGYKVDRADAVETPAF